MTNVLAKDWYYLLKDEFKKDYFSNLRNFLNDEYKHHIIHPDKENIFNALNFTPYENIKVVILGQDPYHGMNQAHGLSFSVNPTVAIPPSLNNIYKELNSDLNQNIIKDMSQGTTILHASKSIPFLKTIELDEEDNEYFNNIFNEIVILKKKVSLLKNIKDKLLIKYFTNQ